MSLRQQLGPEPGVVRLDGATATELQRRGIVVRGPWWTSTALRTPHGREILRSVHDAYVAAGAQVLTANTFRGNLRALGRAGLDVGAAAEVVHQAVAIARAAASSASCAASAASASAAAARSVWVAGAMAPVEDCYRPDLVPSSAVLNREHRWLAGELVTAGVDLIVVETMNCLREARVALAQSLAAGARTFVSFVVGDDARLLSGEPIDSTVRAVEQDGAHGVLVNCAGLAVTHTCLRRMRSVARGPIGACPNVVDRVGVAAAAQLERYRPVVVGADEFAETVLRWVVELGVELVGGCCGTTPAHIAALAQHASH